MTQHDDDLPEETLEGDAPSAALEALAREAKERLVPADRDWDAIEAKLFARIDEAIENDAPSAALAAATKEAKEHLVPSERNWDAIERRVLARTHHKMVTSLRIPWRGMVAASAIAAGAAAIFAASRTTQLSWEGTQAAVQTHGGVLGANDGHVSIAGRLASAGQAVNVGDRVEVGAGHAVFQQAGRVTWSLEAQSRARVMRTEGGLVLALEQGATEAEVAAVPSGEAFAVDIADAQGHVARVAVHGTHLRVARSGDHVVVDLTEGVVTVGRAPRAGSTYGKLVTAPAHIEFDVASADVVRIDHQGSAVRPAAVLAFNQARPAVQEHVAGHEPLLLSKNEPQVEPKAVLHPTAPPVVARPDDVPDPTPVPDPDPETQIRAAAMACFAHEPPRTDGVEVHASVSTELTFPIDETGKVHSFQFSPPLEKATQDCVGKTIWTLRFPEGSSKKTMRIDLSR